MTRRRVPRRHQALRLARLAYPRSFRRELGEDFVQATVDLARHGGVGRARLAWKTAIDVACSAPTMRWEAFMSRPHAKLFAVSALFSVALMAAVVGSPAFVLLVAAVGGLLALRVVTARRPLLPAGHPPHPLRWALAGRHGCP